MGAAGKREEPPNAASGAHTGHDAQIRRSPNKAGLVVARLKRGDKRIVMPGIAATAGIAVG